MARLLAMAKARHVRLGDGDAVLGALLALRPRPCGPAMEWTARKLRTMAPSDVWGLAQREESSWAAWLRNRLGLGDKAVPWATVEAALKKPPPPRKTCDSCGDALSAEEIDCGVRRCEECAQSYIYCTVCDDSSHEEDLCGHLAWSDARGEHVGTGTAAVVHRESFDALLVRLGLVMTRRLRKDLAGIDLEYGFDSTYYKYTRAGRRLEDLRQRARDVDRCAFEVGLLWLNTLYLSQTELVALTLGWIDAHIARREAAIKADKRKRHLVRDGGHRWWTGAEWTAIREQGLWMHKAKAGKVRRRLRRIYGAVGADCKVVRVLTPAPAFREPNGGSK